MPRKTTILIIILALVTGVLIFLAVRSDQTQDFMNSMNRDETPSPTTVQPFAALAFSVPELNASTGSTTQSVDINLNTNGKPVTGAQVELTYDPEALSNVRVESPVNSLFGTNPTILINSVDPTQGRISYAVGINASDAEKVGSGPIATLKFTVNRLAGLSKSQITFLPKSAVTSVTTQGSVLSDVAPLQIILNTPTAVPSAN